MQFLGALQTGTDFENVAYMAIVVLVTVIGMDPKAAFKEVQIEELGNFSLEMINNLKKVLSDEKLI